MYLSKQKSLFVFVIALFTNQSFNVRHTFNLFNKIIVTFVKDINIHLKLLKMFDSKSSKISALLFKMPLA